MQSWFQSTAMQYSGSNQRPIMFTYSQALRVRLVAGLFLELQGNKKGNHRNDVKKKKAGEMFQEEYFSFGLKVKTGILSNSQL